MKLSTWNAGPKVNPSHLSYKLVCKDTYKNKQYLKIVLRINLFQWLNRFAFEKEDHSVGIKD